MFGAVERGCLVGDGGEHAASRVTRCAFQLASGQLPWSNWVDAFARCRRWTPGNEIDRGLGKARPHPSNHRRGRGDKTGPAMPHSWAINKLGSTPCKQTAPELLPSGRLCFCCLTIACRRSLDPGTQAATQQFAPSHWPHRPRPHPLPASEPSAPGTQTTSPEALRPIFEAALARAAAPSCSCPDLFFTTPHSALITAPSCPRGNSIEIRVLEDGSAH